MTTLIGIVNPTFNPTTGITIGENQALLDLGSVGAFQHVGTSTNESNKHSFYKSRHSSKYDECHQSIHFNNHQLC